MMGEMVRGEVVMEEEERGRRGGVGDWEVVGEGVTKQSDLSKGRLRCGAGSTQFAGENHCVCVLFIFLCFTQTHHKRNCVRRKNCNILLIVYLNKDYQETFCDCVIKSKLTAASSSLTLLPGVPDTRQRSWNRGLQMWATGERERVGLPSILGRERYPFKLHGFGSQRPERGRFF